MKNNLPIFVANWKMNLNYDESIKLARDYIGLGLRSIPATIYLAPSSFALHEVKKILEETEIKVAAQDCSVKAGYNSFTGELSSDQIASTGASAVLIGHSERRSYFFESGKVINQKLLNALNSGLTAILSVSETLEDYQHNETKQQLKHQLYTFLNETEKDSCPVENMIIAYEPVWAISTSFKHADPSAEYIAEMISFIRKYISTHCGHDRVGSIPILYGGSVTNHNSEEFLEIENVDGLLVGKSSLDANEFRKIVISSSGK